MKKSVLYIVSALIIVALLLSGCGPKAEVKPVEPTAEKVVEIAAPTAEEAKDVAAFSKDQPITVKIGASPAPHAEILKKIQPALEEKGVKIELIEFTDYVLPNTSLEDGSLDANYFQHQPYLDDFNKNYAEKNAKWINLVSIAWVHFEPMGIYGGKTKSLTDIKDGAKIAVPNDPTNEARALLLLEANGLIKIKEGKGLEATKKDIAENAKNLEIVELEAAQIPRSLPDMDFGVINGNYAIEAGLKAADMIAAESTDSEAAKKYANVLVVRDGDQERPELKLVAEALLSAETKSFIEATYAGAVVSMTK